MLNIGKILLLVGGIFILAGLIFILASKWGIPNKLPGDIAIEKKDFYFYFPITTCIIISIILSLIFYLAGKFFK